MINIEQLLDIAANKHSGEQAVLDRLPKPLTSEKLAQISDDRYLSAMTKCVFRAGFVWRVIEQKWPDFEAVFHQFNPMGAAYMSDERVEKLMQDTRIVRHRQKILALRENAKFILEVAESHGSFGKLIADWPSSEIIDLWALLKRRGSRLGGATGPGFLRIVNKDTFILTADVKKALVNHDLIDSIPTESKKTLQVVQSIFNQLSDESGWSLSQISRLLALTV